MPTAAPIHRTYPERTDARQAAHLRGYDHRWAKVAAMARVRDCYLCQPCMRAGFTTPAKTVDHIIPVRVRPDLRLAIENTQVICSPCHTRKTNEDNLKYRPISEVREEERERYQDQASELYG